MTVPPDRSYTDANSLPPDEEFASALSLLRTIIEGSQEETLLDPDDRPTTKMVYTNGVTLWMLILQRLGGGKSLGEVVSQVLAPQFLFGGAGRVGLRQFRNSRLRS